MITCFDREISNKLRILRAHGWIRNIDISANKIADDIDSRYAFISQLSRFNLK